MKIMIVQLSDMHCKVNDGNMSLKIKKVANAIRTLGKVDRSLLVFSGDLTNSGSSEERY